MLTTTLEGGFIPPHLTRAEWPKVRDIIIVVSAVVVGAALWDLLGSLLPGIGRWAIRIIGSIAGLLAYWWL